MEVKFSRTVYSTSMLPLSSIVYIQRHFDSLACNACLLTVTFLLLDYLISHRRIDHIRQ